MLPELYIEAVYRGAQHNMDEASTKRAAADDVASGNGLPQFIKDIYRNDNSG